MHSPQGRGQGCRGTGCLFRFSFRKEGFQFRLKPIQFGPQHILVDRGELIHRMITIGIPYHGSAPLSQGIVPALGRIGRRCTDFR